MQEVPKHKHLAKTAIFWCAFLIPLGLGGGLGLFVGNSVDLGRMCFTPECVQNFFNVFKFPIAIMGLSLPLVAMAAAIHRSMEAALQIDFASRQYGEAIINNRFGNYLKHREGFDKLVDNFCSRADYGEKSKLVIHTSNIYGRFFPDSGFNNVEWVGGYSKQRLEIAEGYAKVLMDQATKAADEFDPIKFILAVKYLNASFNIIYSPFVTVKASSESGGSEADVMVPRFGDEISAIAFAANDGLGMLSLFRSYIGNNDSDDLVIGGYIYDIIDNFKRSNFVHTSVVGKL